MAVHVFGEPGITQVINFSVDKKYQLNDLSSGKIDFHIFKHMRIVT